MVLFSSNTVRHGFVASDVLRVRLSRQEEEMHIFGLKANLANEPWNSSCGAYAQNISFV